MAEIFGTDGARGLAIADPETEIMTGEGFAEYDPGIICAAKVALLTSLAVEAQGPGTYVVGRDTRPSSPELQAAAVRGIVAAGGTPLVMDVAPTPAVQHQTRELGAAGAFTITASHNPYRDNGLKPTGPEGVKLSSAQTREIAQAYTRRRDSGLFVPDFEVEYNIDPQLLENYISAVVDDVRELFDNERPLANKVFVIDAANGAAENVTPEVFRRLGATVHEFACDSSQGLINDGVGVTHPGGARRFLEEHPEIVADENFVGVIYNDGDADRAGAMGARIENGEVATYEINGNTFLELFTEEFAPEDGGVGTIYTNNGTRIRMAEKGIAFYQCDNGDIAVTKMLTEKGLTQGWEASGHGVDMRWLTSGDGVRNAAVAAAIAVRRDATFADLHDQKPMWPERHLEVELGNLSGKAVMGHERVVDALGTADERLAQFMGKRIVRGSGTQPLVRVYVTSPNAAIVEEVSAYLHYEVGQAAHAQAA